jgi:hypothetical protein
MGYLGGSTFRFLRRQQTWRGNGSREIAQPEQPERSAADEARLAANDKPPTKSTGRLAHFVNAAQQSRKP